MLIILSAFGVFFICLLAESVTSWLFIRGSRKKHPALWRHAGCPTIIGNGDLTSAWPLIRYITRRRYEALDDEAAVLFADKLRLPTIVSYWAAVGSAVAAFATLLLL